MAAWTMCVPGIHGRTVAGVNNVSGTRGTTATGNGSMDYVPGIHGMTVAGVNNVSGTPGIHGATAMPGILQEATLQSHFERQTQIWI
jgi:hypothetical protein